MTLAAVDHVTRRFGGVVALDDVSFGVETGEILGLIGPNGAGKSTMFGILAGSIRPTEGSIHFGGRCVTGWSPHKAAAAGMVRTFQLMRVLRSMTVLENVMIGAYLRHRGTAGARRAAFEALEDTGMTALADVSALHLTAGWKKRLEVARALATEPTLLLLDEVLSGLTPTESVEAVGLIRAINQRGVTIVMVEHVMEVIMPLCDRIVVLDHGRKIAEDAPARIAIDPVVVEAYLGIAPC